MRCKQLHRVGKPSPSAGGVSLGSSEYVGHLQETSLRNGYMLARSRFKPAPFQWRRSTVPGA